MKQSLIYTIAGAFVATLLTTTAFAGTTIDKGVLGKYERQGRFVKPVMTPSAHTVSQFQTAALVNDGHVMLDKGALGKYERQGRIVRPVVEFGGNNWTSGAMTRGQGGVKHVHGLNGKEHRNVKLGLPNR